METSGRAGVGAIARGARADRCPGLARPFTAQDGALVRVRVPGGRLAVAAITDLLAIAADHGAPVLQLTTRGSLQLRALPDPLPADLVTRLEATGLFPSPSHELARNIIASPRRDDLASLVAELDTSLVADAELAALPGRFLFAVGGVGDGVLGEPWDIAYEAIDDHGGRVLAGSFAVEVSRRDAAAELLSRARLFLRHRGDDRIWNVRELPARGPVFAGMTPYAASAASPDLPGAVGDDLVAGVPLGLLRAPHVAALSKVSEYVTLTPWRSLVVAGGAVHAAGLASAGLVTTPRSPWARLSACVGAPSCGATTSRTLDLTAAAAAVLPATGPRLHVVGCERRCGRPSGEHVAVVAPRSVRDIVVDAGADS
ncbi:cobalamin biosynthesis protein CobG [Pedococcus sp. NPDC057267]|uniref:cobalamin biosynthesis protein CobG n=1 Tax=Pedococcus sp. NPDC057267 TaxID=3346077 RepID=UPI00362B1430